MKSQMRVHNAWGALGFADKLLYLFHIKFVSLTYRLTEAIMRANARGAFFAAVLLYVIFFLTYADRLPRFVFVAGVFLGVILGAVAVLLLIPHKNGNGNGNHNH